MSIREFYSIWNIAKIWGGHRFEPIWTDATLTGVLWVRSFFAKWFGRKAPEVEASDALKTRLLEAFARSDGTLSRLCREHSPTIVAEFERWAVVPVEIRSDSAAVQRYVAGMLGIARLLAHDLGERGPLDRLVAPPAGNPIVEWEKRLGEARQLMDELDYSRASKLLESSVERAQGLSGTAVDRYLPITLGSLGECYFQRGDADKAVTPTSEALALCEVHADHDGIVAYQRNLYEMHRYLGSTDAAAKCAEALADALERAGAPHEARWYRKQSRLVRAGEPENRVVVRAGDQRHELDELPSELAKGSVTLSFAFERNRITLRPAAELTSRAERLGSDQEYERALQTLRAAAQADVYDPHCHFLEGLTLCHLGRYREAVSSYDACETRAAGWYVCRADRWLAQQIAEGQLEPGVFSALRDLEQTEGPPRRRVANAQKALEKYPPLAGLYLALGRSLEAADERHAALSAYRSGLEAAPDPDTRTRLLVYLGNGTADKTERLEALTQAVSLKGNLVSAAMAQVALTLQQFGQSN